MEQIAVIQSPGPVAFMPSKLTPPPVPAEATRRSRLFATLDDATSSVPLTVVMGPAGSGKTTLLASWAEGKDVAWVSLDPHDDDPDRFWALVLTAVGAEHRPECGGDPACSLAAHANDAEAPVLLVLDDADVIRNAQIREDLRRLVRCPPRGLRIVVTCRRAVDALRLSRLRIQGLARVIEGGSLNLSQEETEQLFARAGANVRAQDARDFQRCTEGWVVAARLASLEMRDGARSHGLIATLSGQEAYVSDYLTEELIDDLDPGMRDFLLRTSIVDEICGELADALTDGHGGGGTLEALRSAGLPISPVDPHGETYRYHPLLAGMLRASVRRQDTAMVLDLHRRAATWFAGCGLAAPAARHAVSSHDPALLHALVIEHAPAALRDGVIDELAAALGVLDTHALAADPALALTVAIAAYDRGDVDAGDRWLDRVARPAAGADADSGDLAALAVLARLRACGDDLPAGGIASTSSTGIVNAIAGTVELWAGDTDGAERHLAVAATQCERHERLAGIVAAHLSVCRLRRADGDGAQLLAREALERSESDGGHGRGGAAAVALAVLGCIALERREHAVAAGAFAEAAAIAAAGELRFPGERAFVTTACAHWRSLPQAGHYAGAADPAGARSEVDEPLSEAELAILRYLPTRLTNLEIAGERCLSVNTVKTHLKHIYRKLGAGDRATAVTRARQLGLVTVSAI